MLRSRLRRPWTVLLAAGSCAVLAAIASPAVSASARPDPPDLSDVVEPIDPQQWENPDDMTWADYQAIPGTSWADASRGACDCATS